MIRIYPSSELSDPLSIRYPFIRQNPDIRQKIRITDKQIGTLPVDDITDSMAGLSLNSVINTAVKRAVKKSSSKQKCSKCGRSGHNSRKCPRKKKKKSKSKGKLNLATVDSGTSSDSSSSDSSDSDTSSSDSSDSDGGLDVHITKSKKSEAEV